jgi:hypothetical protein
MHSNLVSSLTCTYFVTLSPYVPHVADHYGCCALLFYFAESPPCVLDSLGQSPINALVIPLDREGRFLPQPFQSLLQIALPVSQYDGTRNLSNVWHYRSIMVENWNFVLRHPVLWPDHSSPAALKTRIITCGKFPLSERHCDDSDFVFHSSLCIFSSSR